MFTASITVRNAEGHSVKIAKVTGQTVADAIREMERWVTENLSTTMLDWKNVDVTITPVETT